jgi:diguanylate cyclase (GGDEF)-like protein
MNSPTDTPLVLLIDDAEDVHRLLKAKATYAGYRLTSAYNVAGGLKAAAALGPDLVLLDLWMPNSDGFSALKALKDNPVTMNIPVIVLSGSNHTADKVRAFELGAADFVSKPFDFTVLSARLRNAHRTSRLLFMLAQQSHIDGLTGLKNRAHFDEEFHAQLKRRQRSHTDLSLVLTDLDHFKRVNDDYGHPAGDAALEAFAKLLARSVRGDDSACRYGGEEFALILPGTAATAAAQLCERIRAAAAALEFPRYPGLSVTASFGVADRPVTPGSNSNAAWIEAADRALYDAKQSGRNRVHLFTETGGVSALKIAS